MTGRLLFGYDQDSVYAARGAGTRGSAVAGAIVTRPERDGEPDDKPVLPVQSEDETDVGWGEAAEPDDERLRRDRPPHWDQ